jgi:hypothetical protein
VYDYRLSAFLPLDVVLDFLPYQSNLSGWDNGSSRRRLRRMLRG